MSYLQPSREGQVGIVFHVSPELRQGLKIMAAEKGTTVQAIFAEIAEKELAKQQAKKRV